MNVEERIVMEIEEITVHLIVNREGKNIIESQQAHIIWLSD